MTHPDLLEQAVAEAEYKQAAGAAAHGVAERAAEAQRGPFEGFDLVSFSTIPLELGSYQQLAKKQNIRVPVSEQILLQWSVLEQRQDPPQGGLVAVLRPLKRFSMGTLGLLERQGLRPATARDLLLCNWRPTQGNERLWAFGSLTRTVPINLSVPPDTVPYRMMDSDSRDTMLLGTIDEGPWADDTLLVRFGKFASDEFYKWLDQNTP